MRAAWEVNRPPMVASNAISDPGLPVNVKASREPVTSVAVTGQKDGAGASKHLYSTPERLMGLPVADWTTAWLAWPAAEARTLSIEPASEASNATCTGGPARRPRHDRPQHRLRPGVAATLLTRGAPSAIVEAVSDRTDAARAVAGLAWRVVVIDVGFWLFSPHPHNSRQRSAPLRYTVQSPPPKVYGPPSSRRSRQRLTIPSLGAPCARGLPARTALFASRTNRADRAGTGGKCLYRPVVPVGARIITLQNVLRGCTGGSSTRDRRARRCASEAYGPWAALPYQAVH